MSKKIVFPIVLALLLSFVMAGTAYAAGPKPGADANTGSPKQAARLRAEGLVSAVDAAAGTFSVTGCSGEVWTFQVVERTQFRGGVKSLTDLKTGMQAGVAGHKVDDSLVALVVMARNAPEKIAGKVTAVNSAASSFTLNGKDGVSYTILTNAETRFNSPDGSIKSLADLKPEMLAGALVVKQADGSLLAKAVLAGTVQADTRMAGKVTAVAGQSFTITNLKGETVTFAVTAETKYTGLDGSSVSLADLKTGQRIGVAADKQDDGSYLAKLVIFKPEK